VASTTFCGIQQTALASCLWT